MNTNSASSLVPRLVAVVLTRNESRHIAECLRTLDWADARIVVDSLSDDDTVQRARAEGAEVVERPFENYALQRNAALAHAAGMHPRADWVFFVDADERCTPELASELRTVSEDPTRDVWAVPRHNFIFGKLTLGAGWFPDFQARLFRVGRADFEPARAVHEVARHQGQLGRLRATLDHYNYDSVAQFHEKQRRYAEYDAGILFEQGVRPKPRNFVLQPLREFRRRFVSLGGYRDGAHGLRLSALMAWYSLDMYRRLARMWRDAK
ncbi:MAG: glycosyltransferase family 2 protein [Thermoflexales bacterium]